MGQPWVLAGCVRLCRRCNRRDNRFHRCACRYQLHGAELVPDGNYRVVLSADGTQTSAPVSSLPGEWVNVGERWAGVSDTVRDGVLEAVVVSRGMSGCALQRRDAPAGQDATATGGVNPGATLRVPVSADVMTSATTDPDGRVIGFQITTFPTGADASALLARFTPLPVSRWGIFVGIGDVGQISVDPVGSID